MLENPMVAFLGSLFLGTKWMCLHGSCVRGRASTGRPFSVIWTWKTGVRNFYITLCNTQCVFNYCVPLLSFTGACYCVWYHIHSDIYSDMLRSLCGNLYDMLRPLIIHVYHLETLAELCTILKTEMIDDHVQNNRMFIPLSWLVLVS